MGSFRELFIIREESVRDEDYLNRSVPRCYRELKFTASRSDFTDYFLKVLARRDHGRERVDISKIPGCEDAEAFKGIKAETCCSALPEIFINKELYEGCKTPGKKGNKCAALNCVLKAANVTDEAGKFDPAKAKETLTASVKNDAAWVSFVTKN